MLDHGRQELLVMEALHIQMTPSEEHFVKTEDWKSLIAGLQWSGTQKGTILVNLGSPMTCILHNALLLMFVYTSPPNYALSLKKELEKSFLISSW